METKQHNFVSCDAVAETVVSLRGVFIERDGQEFLLVVEVLGAPEEDEYFPTCRIMGFGNPPAWDCHLHYPPKQGDEIPVRTFNWK